MICRFSYYGASFWHGQDLKSIKSFHYAHKGSGAILESSYFYLHVLSYNHQCTQYYPVDITIYIRNHPQLLHTHSLIIVWYIIISLQHNMQSSFGTTLVQHQLLVEVLDFEMRQVEGLLKKHLTLIHPRC